MTPAIEPFYASMALYDAKLKKKVIVMRFTFRYYSKHYFLLQFSLRDKLTHFFWVWVGTMENRELENNYYSEKVRKGLKEARCNGSWSVEVEILRMIEGKGRRWWRLGYENTLLQDDALFY
jgi:hypothetical protein